MKMYKKIEARIIFKQTNHYICRSQMEQRIRGTKIEKYSRSFDFNFELEKTFHSFLFVRYHTAKISVARYHGKKG